MIFKKLGYGKENSKILTEIYEQQGYQKYLKGEYKLGKLDNYGQRIDIEIKLDGIGSAKGKTYYLKSGWMIMKDGKIKLNTPFTGFTR